MARNESWNQARETVKENREVIKIATAGKTRPDEIASKENALMAKVKAKMEKIENRQRGKL